MKSKVAIEWLKTDISRLWNTPMNNLHKEALEMAIKALENQCPSKWISVKDRLPKKREKVLCTLDDEFYDEGEIKILYLTNSYGGGVIWVDGYIGTENYDVCAWMPLPKPYVKEVEE